MARVDDYMFGRIVIDGREEHADVSSCLEDAGLR
jgi:hypothetical protein